MFTLITFYIVNIAIPTVILIIGLIISKVTKKIIKSDKFKEKTKHDKFKIRLGNFFGVANIVTGIVGILDYGTQFLKYLFFT
ncbi:hypothetical protein SDC9_184075 [bioreactor metagenome]|uniref:Uncharacterized protein n=1 Tax=bioreactor metagenome TaxID=1076179 RepID=A0A645HDG0_9ZZZZ